MTTDGADKQLATIETPKMARAAVDALRTLLLCFPAGPSVSDEDFFLRISGFVQVLAPFKIETVVQVANHMLRHNPNAPFPPTPPDLYRQCYEIEDRPRREVARREMDEALRRSIERQREIDALRPSREWFAQHEARKAAADRLHERDLNSGNLIVARKEYSEVELDAEVARYEVEKAAREKAREEACVKDERERDDRIFEKLHKKLGMTREEFDRCPF
jgi:hypothetical protein